MNAHDNAMHFWKANELARMVLEAESSGEGDGASIKDWRAIVVKAREILKP